MLDREACERRVYRLAALLTGKPRAATRVISAVVGAQPDLRRLDDAHMDRLTVLRSREIDTAILAEPSIPRPVAEGLASLTAQQREAWVFSAVYRLELREMARAMDCSTRAAQRHLDLAEAAMARATGGRVREAAEALLRYSMSLEVPEFYRARRRRRLRLRLALRIAGIVLIIALLTAAFGIVGWLVLEAGRPPEGPALPGAGGNDVAEPAPEADRE
ncbi:MAG: hypothetical protein SYC29_16490 [Planctomycetota bacterium]|nr:hypothetical protein [Planctomycetota bacterium]